RVGPFYALISISYAHIDDEPDPAFPDRPGWVTTLVRCLERRIAKKLGRVDSYHIWRDPKLAGHVDLTLEIIGRVRDAAMLLLVLSPDYLASDWCRRELRAFDEAIRGRKAARSRILFRTLGERKVGDPHGSRSISEDERDPVPGREVRRLELV